MVIGMAVNSGNESKKRELTALLDKAFSLSIDLGLWVEGKPFDVTLRQVSNQLTQVEQPIPDFCIHGYRGNPGTCVDCQTDAHPHYQHNWKNGRCILKGCKAEQEKAKVYLSCQYCHNPAGDQHTKENGYCYDCKQKMVDEGHAWEENKSAYQRRADLANVHSFTERNA